MTFERREYRDFIIYIARVFHLCSMLFTDVNTNNANVSWNQFLLFVFYTPNIYPSGEMVKSLSANIAYIKFLRYGSQYVPRTCSMFYDLVVTRCDLVVTRYYLVVTRCDFVVTR